MAGLDMDLTPSGDAIYITLLEEFQRCPPQFFTPNPSSTVFRHDVEQVNVCDRSKRSKSMFPDSMGGVLVISTEAQLQQLTSRLLERPIFFTVDIERTVNEMCSKVTRETRGRLAVTVNTKHPHVHQLMMSWLAQGADALRRGQNFAVEFDFDGIFISWLKDVYQRADMEVFDCGWNIMYSCKNGKVTVTNYSEFDDMFACEPSLAIACVICLPCCLLAFPCYRIHRAIKVEDFGGKVNGIKATYWNANAQLQGMESVITHVLALIAQDNAAQARTVDMPPSYDAAVGDPVVGGGQQRTSHLGGIQQPVGQPVVQQPGYAQPMGQQSLILILIRVKRTQLK
ncbi:uncharacterized protein LOC110987853 [Acanthaster planci]|uniref:Uncharacterized protein LOC110987853 n=1 Tax=Acanthaster planci TaxID=133434 RepID=A0A8B7ZNM2_ACAPL|nr:uncharacterized protein LOC110987853 [Acanthaster planci]